MLTFYEQQRAPVQFFSGFFTTRPENFHTAEEVEIDIERSEEDISVAVHDISTGHRMNSTDIYTNKGFKPPVHKEAFPINSHDLLKRVAGENPFEDMGFRVRLTRKFLSGMRKVEAMIRRAMEYQASQVLQTGVVTLTDENGAQVYQIDYKPKATHFPTAGTAWGQAGADPIGDIDALANVIRGDGLVDPGLLIMGDDAFNAFILDDGVKAYLDNRRIDLGQIGRTEVRGNGGTYKGSIDIGNYKYEIWTYAGRYKDPQTGVSTKYMDPSKVIVMDAGARLDATFGGIPNIGKLLGANPSPVVLPVLPGRLSSTDSQMDLNTNVWLTPDGAQLFGGVGARPLMIPTAIDTFGCLETNA
jgi:hypothetical protein